MRGSSPRMTTICLSRSAPLHHGFRCRRGHVLIAMSRAGDFAKVPGELRTHVLGISRRAVEIEVTALETGRTLNTGFLVVADNAAGLYVALSEQQHEIGREGSAQRGRGDRRARDAVRIFEFAIRQHVPAGVRGHCAFDVAAAAMQHVTLHPLRAAAMPEDRKTMAMTARHGDRTLERLLVFGVFCFFLRLWLL